MPYTPLNPGIKIRVRADRRAKDRAAAAVAAGQRWEFRRGMYGNTYEVVDHENFRWYRQDRPVHNQGDLFEGTLPFCCDYCRQIVDEIDHVNYEMIYEMKVRPKLPTAAWSRSLIPLKYARCVACQNGPLPFPSALVGYHLTELRQNGEVILRQERKES